MYPSTGTPTATAGISNANQVLAAVAADPTAASLLTGTLTSGSSGTGAVTAMSQSYFTLAKETYATPMSFIDTSTNDAGNILIGDVNFGCTTQNLGIVTGTSAFSQCSAPGAPTTTDPATDFTPTLTGTCTPKTLVTLYAENWNYDQYGMPTRS